MRTVAVEEHFSLHTITSTLNRLPEDRRDPMVSGFATPTMERRLCDLGRARVADMDQIGIDVQVVSLTSPGVQPLDDEHAVPLAKAANDVLASAVDAQPDRLQWFATLPTGVPEDTAAELERAVALGAQGAMVFGRTGDRHLDHPDNYPLLAAAARLRAPLSLHPQTPKPSVRAAYYDGLEDPLSLHLATGGLGWHYETGLELIRLILSGAFDRHPDLQIILGHWGEVVLFYLERLEVLAGPAKLERPLIDYFRRNVFITPSGILSERYLRWTIDLVGAERLLFATDYPYVTLTHDETRGFLETSSITDAERSAIAHRNWDRLTETIVRPTPAAKRTHS